jgi:hypothetical protein
MPASPPAGAYPVGSYPAALDLSTAQVGVFLADAIDPETLDYRSIERGVDPVEAAALEALLVRRASGSAVRDDGLKLDDITKIDEAFETTLKAEVRYAWRRLIEDRKIELVTLQVLTDGDTANVVIVFRNLTESADPQRKSLAIPLLSLQGRRN